MTQEHASINGALLRLRREARGWVQSDVATRACMSVKQIRQLEDGGLSAFYSEAVKVTAAKKVGALLGLTPDEVFSHGQPEVATAASSISPEADLAALLASTHESAHDEPFDSSYQQSHDHATHTLATAHHTGVPESAPVSHDSAHEHVEPSEVTAQAETTPASVAPVLHTHDASEAAAPSLAALESTPAVQPAKSKSSLLWLVVLFVGAIVLAAVFKPEQESAPTEPPPPLQPALQSEPGVEAGKEAGKDGVPAPDGTQPGASPGTTPGLAPGVAPAAGNATSTGNAAAPSAAAPASVAPSNGSAASPAAASPSAPAAPAAATPSVAPKSN